MPLTRRDALRLGGGVGLASVAGCAALPSNDPGLALTVLNWTTGRHLLRVRLLRTDRDHYGEAAVLDDEFRLDPYEDGRPFAVEKQGVAKSRKYLVRASISGNTGDAVRHGHYYPGEDADEPTIHVELREREETGEPYLRIF